MKTFSKRPLNQRKAMAVKIGKARVRFMRALQYAEEGYSLSEAAAALAMKEGGLEGLLYRNLGSRRWPPASS